MDQKLRILFVWGYMDIGGAQIAGLELARALKKKGHYVAYLSEGGSLVKELEEVDIPHYVGKVNTKDPLTMYKAASLVEKISIQDKIQVYYCDGIAQTVMAYLASRRVYFKTRNRPGVTTVKHGHEKALYYYISSPLYNFLSDHVMGVCEFERRRLISHGLNPNRVSTLYNALPLANLPFPLTSSLHQELNLDKEIPLLGYVGRLSPEKDVGTLVKGFGKVATQSSAHLVIVGDGPEREYLEWLVGDLAIQKKVHFLGYRRDIPQILAALKGLLLSSTRELFPMVVLEAFYYKVPVVATDIGGVGEVVKDGETGYKVPPCEPTLLAEKIKVLLDNPSQGQKMGERGREMVLEQFSLDKAVSQLEEVLSNYSSGGS